MAKFTILHNQRCGKSRNALKLLKEEGHDMEVREYLDDPLSEKELQELLAIAKFNKQDLVRNKEAKDSGVNTKTDDLVKAIAKYPNIMQRPVVIKDGRAVIARDDGWFEQL
ncbi:MAG: arsenate reductase (glutaredoxin) [Cyanobacteria bacterium]|nr:arsenate reductase (glutaredoxin) [Cyanobacteriota bacterium]MDA1020318.1 arsenate reductase (glutaredoxin) [Cyanobacteriota bacterium]